MAAMTKQEMTRAMTLLEEDDLEELAKIKVGKWAITTENGIYGIYETKSEAIEDALARQMQTRNHAKVTRFGKGAYTLGILDCDEDPGAFTITTRLEGLHRPICWNIKKLRSAPCFRTGISTHTHKSIRSISKWVWSRTVETRPR